MSIKIEFRNGFVVIDDIKTIIPEDYWKSIHPERYLEFKPVIQDLNKPVIQDLNKPVIQDLNKPVIQDLNKPVVQDLNKPVIQDLNKPVIQDLNKPVIQDLNKPVIQDKQDKPKWYYKGKRKNRKIR